jgi:hypothetical protein
MRQRDGRARTTHRTPQDIQSLSDAEGGMERAGLGWEEKSSDDERERYEHYIAFARKKDQRPRV